MVIARVYQRQEVLAKLENNVRQTADALWYARTIIANAKINVDLLEAAHGNSLETLAWWCDTSGAASDLLPTVQKRSIRSMAERSRSRSRKAASSTKPDSTNPDTEIATADTLIAITASKIAEIATADTEIATADTRIATPKHRLHLDEGIAHQQVERGLVSMTMRCS